MLNLVFVRDTLEKYGLAHLDAKKVLLKMGGRRPGKHCVGKAGGKGSYIAAEKNCAGHKGTDGKLTQAGKQSARELAARVRDRKGMGTQMETKIGRMPMRDFIADIKGKPTEKTIAPMMRKIHKEARSDLNKRRIKSGREAIVDKEPIGDKAKTAAPKEPKKALTRGEKEIARIAESAKAGKVWQDKMAEHKEQLKPENEVKGNDRYNKVMAHQPTWSSVEGIKVLRVANSHYVAVPANGRENSKNWHVIDLDKRGDVVTQLSSREVHSWLANRAMEATDKKAQRSDSTDRAIRYVSNVRRSSHQLRLDDWKRLGRDQMGQKCGRGWQGLRGACKRVPKGGDKEAAIKASKVALADKIRAKKGLRDRNAPKVEEKPKEFIPKRMEYAGGKGGSKPWVAHIPGATDEKYGIKRDFVEADAIKFKRNGKVEKAFFNLKKPGVYADSEGDHFLVKADPKTGQLVSGGEISKNEVYHAIKNDRERWNQLNDPFHKDSTPHFDSHEILRYTRAIERLNDRYGWHLDAQKVLSKLGKKLGKKCGGGWISPEKRCKSHYTNGKLNEAGKASGENLADRIRQRKKLSTVSRNGKGQELSYAFMPGNQKQSTMTARRTHAPKTGYQTPGRLSNLSSTEERRSMVGLGQHPGKKRQPDNAPIMDTNL